MDTGINWGWFGSLLTFAIAMSATPGPNNVMVAASGASWGFVRTVPHMLGVALGFSFMLLAVALGAGAVLHEQPWVQPVLRWVGAAYLLWLAFGIARAKPKTVGDTPRGRPLGFARAALFQWVNPKAWVIAVGAVVTFTSAAGSPRVQAGLMAGVFAGVTLMAVAFWTAVGVGAGRVLLTPGRLRAFNIAMAALLIGSVASLLFGD